MALLALTVLKIGADMVPLSCGRGRLVVSEHGAPNPATPLAADRHWVLSDATVDNKRLMRNQPVDVKGSDVSLMLDARNAMPVV
jgi:hypothetical protein